VGVPVTKEALILMAEESSLGRLLDAEGKRLFQKRVGILNWLAQTTHPDMALPVSVLGKSSANPTDYGLVATVNAMAYLSTTIGRKLKREVGNLKGLECWSDSDWAGMHGTDGETRSRMGNWITYNGFPVSWRSSWIQGRCMSSAEAEVMALSETMKDALHLKYGGEELGMVMPATLRIGCDSSAALAFVENTTSTGRMRHIDIRDDWIQDLRNCDLL
jgi:hypothetical protein